MGGSIALDDVATFGYEVSLNQLKVELHSNIIPIGRIRKGVHAQRAFLFKVSSLFVDDRVRSQNERSVCVDIG
jgi:hypothetical protein